MNREGLRWLILHANRRPANSNIQIPLLNPRSEATTLGKPGSKAVGGRSTSTGHPDPFILLGVLLHLLVSRTFIWRPGRCRKSALARNEGAPPSLGQGPRCHQRAWSWF